jgi:hypothetical protein
MPDSIASSFVQLPEDSGRGLRVRFVKGKDRVAHLVELLIDGRYVPLLESIESDAIEAWPLSPPLQQVHFEQRDGRGHVALLVGMAGRSHWSLSVEPDLALHAIVFDAACRLGGSPRNLGSRYRSLAGAWQCDATGRASLSLGEGHERICVESSDGILAVSDGADVLAIHPTHVEDAIRQTVRWRYAIRFGA